MQYPEEYCKFTWGHWQWTYEAVFKREICSGNLDAGCTGKDFCRWWLEDRKKTYPEWANLVCIFNDDERTQAQPDEEYELPDYPYK